MMDRATRKYQKDYAVKQQNLAQQKELEAAKASLDEGIAEVGRGIEELRVGLREALINNFIAQADNITCNIMFLEEFMTQLQSIKYDFMTSAIMTKMAGNCLPQIQKAMGLASKTLLKLPNIGKIFKDFAKAQGAMAKGNFSMQAFVEGMKTANPASMNSYSKEKIKEYQKNYISGMEIPKSNFSMNEFSEMIASENNK